MDDDADVHIDDADVHIDDADVHIGEATHDDTVDLDDQIFFIKTFIKINLYLNYIISILKIKFLLITTFFFLLFSLTPTIVKPKVKLFVN